MSAWKVAAIATLAVLVSCKEKSRAKEIDDVNYVVGGFGTGNTFIPVVAFPVDNTLKIDVETASRDCRRYVRIFDSNCDWEDRTKVICTNKLGNLERSDNAFCRHKGVRIDY